MGVVTALLAAAVAFQALALVILLLWVQHLLRADADKPVRLVIIPKGTSMDFPNLEPGETAPFDVIGFNKKGKPVPLTDPAAVSTDDAIIATAAVDADGMHGLLTAVADGTTTLRASSGALQAPPKTVTVAQDTVVVSIEILPAAAPV